MIENKLDLTTSAELAREEERISKKRAAELFESDILDGFVPGKLSTLKELHRYLFQDIYDMRVPPRHGGAGSKARLSDHPLNLLIQSI